MTGYQTASAARGSISLESSALSTSVLTPRTISSQTYSFQTIESSHLAKTFTLCDQKTGGLARRINPEQHRDRRGQPATEQTGSKLGKMCQIRCVDSPAPRLSIGLPAAKASAVSPLLPTPIQSRTFANMRLCPPQRPITSSCCGRKKTFRLQMLFFNLGMDDCLTNSTCARMCESKFPVATPSVNHRYLFVPG